MGDYLINVLKSHASSLDQTGGQVKFGTVTSVDYQTATARVQIQPDGGSIRLVADIIAMGRRRLGTGLSAEPGRPGAADSPGGRH